MSFLWGWGWGSKGRRAVGTVGGGKANIYLHSVYQKIYLLFFFFIIPIKACVMAQSMLSEGEKAVLPAAGGQRGDTVAWAAPAGCRPNIQEEEVCKDNERSYPRDSSAATQPSRAERGGGGGEQYTRLCADTFYLANLFRLVTARQTQQEFSGECFGEAKRRKEKRRRLPVHMIQLKQQGMTFRSRTSGHWRNNNVLDGNRMEK